MKLNFPVAMLLLLSLAPFANGQEQTPQLLMRAAHCLLAKDFLPSSRATKLTLGYVLDEKSYGHERIVYVVRYASAVRSNGLVFTLFLTEHEGVRELDIQNNARFVLSKKSKSGTDAVDFVGPPLGGTWTQERLVAAIMQIEKQPRFTVALRDLSRPAFSIRCLAYTDPQPKK